MSGIADAVASGVLPGRVWMYSNYNCNLACTYCLTASNPKSPRRELGAERMRSIAEQAAALGFTDLGVTGGEPFLIPKMVDTVLALSEHLPTVVLTNGTMFGPTRFANATRLAVPNIAVQISLDSPDPDHNDEMRGPENFAKVADVVPRLIDAGVRVRVATTAEPDRLDDERTVRLRELVSSWGVAEADHLFRAVISRGRATDEGMGMAIPHYEIPAELTIAVDGASWSPFGPTGENGRVDTDLLITRTIDPLSVPAESLLRLVEGRPPGSDARLSIR